MRHLAEQTVETLQRENIFELVNDSVMTRTMEGKINFWNHSAEELYGWRKEEAVGRVSHNLLQTQFPKPLEEIESDLVRNGQWEGKLVHTTRDGSRVVVESRWTGDLRGQHGAVIEINTRCIGSEGRTDNTTRFFGKRAIVTGGTGGIGNSIGTALAAGGAEVCLLGRNEQSLDNLASRVANSDRVKLYRCDLSISEEIANFSAEFKRDFDSVDFLIHCAAIIALGPIEENSVDLLDQQFNTNVRAPYILTQKFLPMLKSSRGQIVFINSTAGLAAEANAGQYSATKHALKALTDSLRQEVNSDGIRVLSVFNGRTATPMQASVHASEGRAYRPEKLIQPDDIASVVLNALSLPKTAEMTDVHIRPFAKLRLMPLPLMVNEIVDVITQVVSVA